MKAGPGKTISATPIRRTVPPMSAIISLRKGAATALNAVHKGESHFIRRYVAALVGRVNARFYAANAASFC